MTGEFPAGDITTGDITTGDITTGDITKLDYEQARDELAEVVRALEAGGLSLDESVTLWERGEALAQHCTEQLAGARERVDAVLRKVDPAADPDTDPRPTPDDAPDRDTI